MASYSGGELPFEEALDEIRAGRLSVRSAAAKYNIPRTTLLNHKNNPDVRKNGRPTVLTPAEEEIVVELILTCSEFKIELDQTAFGEALADAARERGIEYTHFGRGWHRLFLKRHPEVAARFDQAKAIRKYVKGSSAKKLKEWTAESAEMYIGMLQGLKDDGFLEDPRGIMNLGETNFEVEISARRAARIAQTGGEGPDKDIVTVLACGLADGTFFRPLLLMDINNTTLLSSMNGSNDDVAIAKSATGVMDSGSLLHYIREEIVPSLQCTKNVLFLAAKTSDVYTVEMMQLCVKYGIRIVCYPGGQISKIQPLGLYMLDEFQALFNDYIRTLAWNPDEELSRLTFPRHLTMVWRQISAQTNLLAGFRDTGIFPFDPQVIRAFVPNALPFPPIVQPASAKAASKKNTRVDPVAQAVSLVKIEDILTADMGIAQEEAHFLVDGLLQILNRRSTVKRVGAKIGYFSLCICTYQVYCETTFDLFLSFRVAFGIVRLF
ncbi:hypothetical protein BV898_12601 [Hypsibius exemplaris]|uniref:HTH psq-type domain-containing protein n=1 Tax=Hypsibius exemplaris TaxID=2072580 RepID=A0A1W0WD85_HYPEX|nr:hypothetical protein BV898_12601 [Hypsibius exemplaris]